MPNTETMRRVGVYCRISMDRDGSSTATGRQLEDCRRMAEARGWEVVDTFEDSDLSAYRRGVVRPEFERMVEAVRAGEIDVVLAWKLDRLSRRLRDFARLDEECEAAGARIVTVVDGIDTSTGAGRATASIMTAFARAESENISVRGARKAREMAQQGRPATGGTRAFGYSRDRMEVVGEEAEIIRELAGRVLAGESVRGLCNDLGRRGVVSGAGKPWQPAPLRRMLVSALLSGQREHGGTLTKGVWPAILTPETTSRLRQVLLDPSRRRSFTNARSYLLSGMLECGRCGEPLIARPRLDHVRRYVCARRPGSDACGRLARVAGPIEAEVVEAVCVALDGVQLPGGAPEPDGGIQDSIRRDEQALIDLAADFAARRFTRGEWFAARDAVEARLRQSRAAAAKRAGRAALADVAGGEALRRRWPGEGLEWRRAVLSAVVDRVVIHPAVKGRNTFDPSLVDIRWRY